MAKNEVRIIGGKWRGRKLKFPDSQGLRPSQDRGRETLFNWLAPWLEGASVLDLFAGSGVLGFEALSRGAECAELVDVAKPVTLALEASKSALAAHNATICRRDALQHLEASRLSYDLVFIDPPFGLSLVAPALSRLIERNLLATDALVYVEQPKLATPEWNPEHLKVYRDKTFGDCRTLLLESR